MFTKPLESYCEIDPSFLLNITYNKQFYLTFIDYVKAFDSVDHSESVSTLLERIIKIMQMLRLYTRTVVQKLD